MTTPYGSAPPPQGQGGIGRLVVNSSHSAGAFILAITGPKIEINGRPVNANWGPWSADVPAGQYHVRVSTRYLGEMGPAQLPVAVYPGQVTTVYYRTPAVMGMSGAIGFMPQKTRGMIALVVAMVVLVAFVALVTLLL